MKRGPKASREVVTLGNGAINEPKVYIGLTASGSLVYEVTATGKDTPRAVTSALRAFTRLRTFAEAHDADKKLRADEALSAALVESARRAKGATP